MIHQAISLVGSGAGEESGEAEHAYLYMTTKFTKCHQQRHQPHHKNCFITFIGLLIQLFKGYFGGNKSPIQQLTTNIRLMHSGGLVIAIKTETQLMN